MSVLAKLSVPVIAAPMAGGPSTIELVNEVGLNGALGFVATGSSGVDKLISDMDQARAPYGVNLFAKQEPLASIDEVLALAGEFGVDVPEVDYTNGWDDKLAAILAAENPPAVVSSTFGSFTETEIRMLHARDIEAWITVTNEDDARHAETVGADVLVVQGPEAGGHRSTWDVESQPDQRPLKELLKAVRDAVNVPIIATGGINEANLRDILTLADAAALGSRFLMSNEAGTNEFNRQLLAAGGTTVSTRAFSGRYARGLETEFTRTRTIGPIYPYLNPLLKPRRKDPAFAYCLVGTQWPREQETVAQIMEKLKAAVE